MKNIECFFDGCCEPKNPGGAMGIGALILIDGNIELEYKKFVPTNQSNTNNIAEYLALEEILNYLIDKNITTENIVISGDSQLAVKQMNGEYGMNNGAYTPYARRCLLKISQFNRKPIIKWIPRDQNEKADKLSKSQLDENGITVSTHSDNKTALPIGKYKGKDVSEITDMQYLKWFISEVKCKPVLKDAIRKRISDYEYLAK